MEYVNNKVNSFKFDVSPKGDFLEELISARWQRHKRPLFVHHIFWWASKGFLVFWECSSRVERPSPKRKIEGSSPSIPAEAFMERIIRITKDFVNPCREEVVWHV